MFYSVVDERSTWRKDHKALDNGEKMASRTQQSEEKEKTKTRTRRRLSLAACFAKLTHTWFGSGRKMEINRYRREIRRHTNKLRLYKLRFHRIPVRYVFEFGFWTSQLFHLP